MWIRHLAFLSDGEPCLLTPDQSFWQAGKRPPQTLQKYKALTLKGLKQTHHITGI
jgi:hypothetical protein